MRSKQHFSYGELIFLESQLITRHIVGNKDCRHTIEFNRGYHGLTIGNYNASNLMGFIFQSEYFAFTISHCQWCSQIRTDESLLLSRNKALGYLHRLVSFVQLKQRPLAFLFFLYVLIPLITLERALNSFHFSKAVMVWGEKTWKIWMLAHHTQKLGGSPEIWSPASSTDLIINPIYIYQSPPTYQAQLHIWDTVVQICILASDFTKLIGRQSAPPHPQNKIDVCAINVS